MGLFIHAQSKKSVENTKIALSVRKAGCWKGVIVKNGTSNGDYRMKKDKEPANLIEEGTIFGDILLGDFDDSFQNLSMKEHLFLDFDKVSKAFIFHWLDSDFISRKSKKSKLRKSDFKF